MSLRNAQEHLEIEAESPSFDHSQFLLTQIGSKEERTIPFAGPGITTANNDLEESGPFHSFLEHLMTYSFPILLAGNLYLALGWLATHGLLWTILIVAPLTWALADFVTGLVHWFADTYGSEETPALGRLIKPFRLHHIYPRDICDHDLVLTIGNSSMLAVPVLGILLFVVAAETQVSGTKAFLAISITLLAAATVATNIFHRWAHAEKTNRLVRLLQRARLILASDHHDLHHSHPFNSNYCITVGWLNPLLERLKFFRGLERVLAKFGLKPAPSCLLERTETAPR